MKTRDEIIQEAARFALFKPTCPHILGIQELLARVLPNYSAARSAFRFEYGRLRRENLRESLETDRVCNLSLQAQ